MSYLYWYLGMGVVPLAVVFGVHYQTREKESEFMRELLETVNPNQKRLSYRILHNVVVPVLVASLVVAIWPLAIYMGAMEMRKKMRNKKKITTDVPRREEVRAFAVEHEHLLERLTVGEIEKRELVTDPFKAVPDLPFGHLHAAWKIFLGGHAESDVLWSFSAHWQTKWGPKELRSGYVIVRDGTPGAHFLTVRKEISDDVQSDVDAEHPSA